MSHTIDELQQLFQCDPIMAQHLHSMESEIAQLTANLDRATLELDTALEEATYWWMRWAETQKLKERLEWSEARKHIEKHIAKDVAIFAKHGWRPKNVP